VNADVSEMRGIQLLQQRKDHGFLGIGRGKLDKTTKLRLTSQFLVYFGLFWFIYFGFNYICSRF